MIYELRIYHTLPGRLADLNARFVNHTLKLWAKAVVEQIQVSPGRLLDTLDW